MKFAGCISGTGSAFPQKVVTNHDLMKTVDTTHEWILDRTGIVQRHIADNANPHERASYLGYVAAQRALDSAGVSSDQVDQIVVASISGDFVTPSVSCLVQDLLQARNACAYDINAACSGFIYALSAGNDAIRLEKAEHVLVIGSEVMSSLVNWEDRASCVIFGDGAGAVLLKRVASDAPARVLNTFLGSNGSGHHILSAFGGGSASPLWCELNNASTKSLEDLHALVAKTKLSMQGPETFKLAVRVMEEYIIKSVEASDYTLEEVDWFLLHQANIRIVETVARRLKLPFERFLCNIDLYANTSSATIPTLLDHSIKSGKIVAGHRIVMCAFGAGLTYGSALMQL